MGLSSLSATRREQQTPTTSTTGSTGRSQGISLRPWSLTFADGALEQHFRAHQRRVWRSTELFRLRLNLIAGLVNLSITAYMLSLGDVWSLSRASLVNVLPYLTAAGLHYGIVCWWPGDSHHINHLGELCYSIICTLSMPTWVLHGDCAEIKAFLRKLVLGSGVLIACYCRFLTPTFFSVSGLLMPLQYGFQAWALSRPTCSALTATDYGRAALERLLSSLDHLAAWVLSAHTAGGGSSDSGADGSHGGGDVTAHRCHDVMYLMQGVACVILVYCQYRLERGTRLAFLRGSHTHNAATQDWPRVPRLVQLVLHVVVLLQLVGVAWALLQRRHGGTLAVSGGRPSSV